MQLSIAYVIIVLFSKCKWINENDNANINNLLNTYVARSLFVPNANMLERIPLNLASSDTLPKCLKWRPAALRMATPLIWSTWTENNHSNLRMLCLGASILRNCYSLCSSTCSHALSKLFGGCLPQPRLGRLSHERNINLAWHKTVCNPSDE